MRLKSQDRISSYKLPMNSCLRVFVFTEDRRHRPVFTPQSLQKRGVPTVALLPLPTTCKDVRKLAQDCCQQNVPAEAEVEVFLLPLGAAVSFTEEGLRVLQDNDSLLVRTGGTPRVQNTTAIYEEASRLAPREVSVDVKIQGIYKLDTVEQVAYMDLLVVSSWREPCLKGIPESRLDW